MIEILGIAALGHLAADFFSQFETLATKPFKCNMCMSYWIGLFPMVLEHGLIGFCYVAMSAIISEIIYKYLSKI